LHWGSRFSAWPLRRLGLQCPPRHRWRQCRPNESSGWNGGACRRHGGRRGPLTRRRYYRVPVARRRRRRLAPRRYRFRLTAPFRDRDRLRRIVDDDRVVDVAEDHVVGRRRHILRRTDIDRHWLVDRHRQHEDLNRRRWWRQHDKFRRRWRQEDHRRRWRRCESKDGIIEYEYRPFHVDDLVRRRWRHFVLDDGEGARRLKRCGQEGKATARVRGVRPARIAPEIRPIGGGRIRQARAAPCDRLASRRKERAHPRGQRIARIGGEKILVARQGIALERHDIRLLRAEIADRPGAHRCALFRRCDGWRRIGGPLEEHEPRLHPRRMPRYLRAPGNVIDAQPHAIEHLDERQAAFPHHLGECLGVRPIRALTLGRDRSGGGVEGHQHARLGLDQSQAARQLRAGSRERVRPRGIEHDDARFQAKRSERSRVIRDANRF
jgi:hypothetical protein